MGESIARWGAGNNSADESNVAGESTIGMEAKVSSKCVPEFYVVRQLLRRLKHSLSNDNNLVLFCSKVSKQFAVFLRATIFREHLQTTASERLNPNEADRLYEKFSRRNTRGKLLVPMRCNL